MRRVLAVVLAVATLLTAFDLAAPAPAEAQSNPPIPRLRVNPGCIADPGSNVVRVRGSGFSRNSQVRLRFYQFQAIGSTSGGIASSGFVGFGPPVAITAQANDIVGTPSTDGLGTFDTQVTLVAPVSHTLLSVPTYGRLWVLEAETVGGGPNTTFLIRSNCDELLVTVKTGCNASNAGQMPGSYTVEAEGIITKVADVEISLNGKIVDTRENVATNGGKISVTFDTQGHRAGDYVARVRGEFTGLEWFALPCPTVTLRANPDCTRIGSPPNRFDLRVVATGLPPFRDAMVIFDSPRAHEYWETEIDSDGRIALTISPYRRPAGTYTLRVRSIDDNESVVKQRTISITIPCQPTTVTAAQTCGRPQIEGDGQRRYSFEVSGSGFAPGPMSVIFDADEVTEPEVYETTANNAGRYSIEIDPRMRPLGEYRIVAQQAASPRSQASLSRGGNVIAAETTFSVPCRDREPPPLTLDPVCGLMAPDESQAYEITVSGSDYYPNSTVIIRFGQAESDVFEVRAARNGTFETTIQPSGKGASRVPVRAQQRDTLGALAAGAAGRFEVPCPIDPSIEISPAFGQPGYTTTVTGTDFWPGTIVSLTWDRGITAGQAQLVEVDEDGHFEAHVFILPNDFPGERTLMVGMDDAPDAFPEVDGTFIVTLGSGVPGGTGDMVGRR